MRPDEIEEARKRFHSPSVQNGGMGMRLLAHIDILQAECARYKGLYEDYSGEVEELQYERKCATDEIARLRKALRFYADNLCVADSPSDLVARVALGDTPVPHGP